MTNEQIETLLVLQAKTIDMQTDMLSILASVNDSLYRLENKVSTLDAKMNDNSIMTDRLDSQQNDQQEAIINLSADIQQIRENVSTLTHVFQRSWE